MEQKFVIFFNDDLIPVVALSMVDYHKNIKCPIADGMIAIGGGGSWKIEGNTLILYGESFDFGKYDIEAAREAFDNKHIYYFNELLFDEFVINKIQCE